MIGDSGERYVPLCCRSYPYLYSSISIYLCDDIVYCKCELALLGFDQGDVGTLFVEDSRQSHVGSLQQKLIWLPGFGIVSNVLPLIRASNNVVRFYPNIPLT